jgi:hypothetical protein
MTISTAYPPVTLLRSNLERYVLDLFEANGSTLKAYTAWPGYYTLPDRSRIPAVYVTGASMVPSNWTITGIECVIEDVPTITSPGSYSGVISIESWNVRFTNYGTKLRACRSRCSTSAGAWRAPSHGTQSRTWPGPRSPSRPSRPASAGPF